MDPHGFTKCRECSHRIKGKRHRGTSLKKFFEDRRSPNGLEYSEKDYFCNACSKDIKRGISRHRVTPDQEASQTMTIGQDGGDQPEGNDSEPYSNNDTQDSLHSMDDEDDSLRDAVAEDSQESESQPENVDKRPKGNPTMAQPSCSKWHKDIVPMKPCKNNEIMRVPVKNAVEISKEQSCDMEMTENTITLEDENTNGDSMAPESFDLLKQVKTEYSEESHQPNTRTSKNCQGSSSKSGKVFLSDVRSFGRTDKRCILCHQNDKTGRRIIPQNVIDDLWLTHRIWIPKGNRSCKTHYISEGFSQESKTILEDKARAGAFLTTKELSRMLTRITSMAQGAPMNLDRNLLEDTDYKLLFGLQKLDFEEVLKSIAAKLRTSYHRSPANALAIFLMKLRLGISHKLLGFLYKIPKRKIGKTFWRVAELLDKYFVPDNVGFGHLSRQELLEKHDSKFARALLKVPDGKIALILDGTYLYTEKSNDHDLQRKTFNLHKCRNLLKPMMVVSPTGYIVSAAGMYFSDFDHNDSNMLADMFKENEGIKDFVNSGDVFVLDRGFRDIKKSLTEKGLQVKMPALLPKTRKQFTAEEANETRMVTMTRWIVESVNGRIKNVFRFFDLVVPAHYFNQQCNVRLSRLFRIACALINRYSPPLFTENEKHFGILEEVEKRHRTSNTLKDEIESENLDKKNQNGAPQWREATRNTLLDFPVLTTEELEMITLGQYQLKNAHGYIDEHLRADSDFSVLIHKDKPGLLRVKLRSKYRRANSHLLWVEYGTNAGEEKVKRYYCKCKSGERTLGCCSHIASVLWFLGFKRHQSPTLEPRTFGTGILQITKDRIRSGRNFDSENDKAPEEPEHETSTPVRFQSQPINTPQGCRKQNARQMKQIVTRRKPLLKKANPKPRRSKCKRILSKRQGCQLSTLASKQQQCSNPAVLHGNTLNVNSNWSEDLIPYSPGMEDIEPLNIPTFPPQVNSQILPLVKISLNLLKRRPIKKPSRNHSIDEGVRSNISIQQPASLTSTLVKIPLHRLKRRPCSTFSEGLIPFNPLPENFGVLTSPIRCKTSSLLPPVQVPPVKRLLRRSQRRVMPLRGSLQNMVSNEIYSRPRAALNLIAQLPVLLPVESQVSATEPEEVVSTKNQGAALNLNSKKRSIVSSSPISGKRILRARNVL